MLRAAVLQEYETERFRLRQLTKSDAESLYRNLSDPALMQFYDMPALQSPDQAEDLLAQWRAAEIAGTGCRWGIAARNTGRFIGTVGYHAIENLHARCEIGYEINPEYWGRGIMSEIFPHVLQHAFDVLRLDRIGALVSPGNIASERLLRKFGFCAEGTLRHYFRSGAEPADALSFSLLTGDVSRHAHSRRRKVTFLI